MAFLIIAIVVALTSAMISTEIYYSPKNRNYRVHKELIKSKSNGTYVVCTFEELKEAISKKKWYSCADYCTSIFQVPEEYNFRNSNRGQLHASIYNVDGTFYMMKNAKELSKAEAYIRDLILNKEVLYFSNHTEVWDTLFHPFFQKEK